MTDPTLESEEVGPEIHFDDDDDNIFEEEPPVEDDDITSVHFEEYARRLGPDLMERDLNMIDGIKEQIPQDIREYIENLRFPKALIGEINMAQMTTQCWEIKGPLVSEREIKLFSIYQHYFTRSQMYPLA